MLFAVCMVVSDGKSFIFYIPPSLLLLLFHFEGVLPEQQQHERERFLRCLVPWLLLLLLLLLLATAASHHFDLRPFQSRVSDVVYICITYTAAAAALCKFSRAW